MKFFILSTFDKHDKGQFLAMFIFLKNIYICREGSEPPYILENLIGMIVNDKVHVFKV